MTVRSADVADALTMGDDCHAYYDRQADELVWVFGDELAAAEDLPEGADVAEAAEAAALTNSGEVDSIKLALLIIEDATGRFVPLPTERDVHEHSIMVDFTTTLPESELRQQLWDGLHRRGAFRRFKDLVHRHGLAEAWYAYREEVVTGIARKWADNNDVSLAD